jgi:hypothetical protein
MEPTNLYITVACVFTAVIGYDIYNWARNRSFTKPEIRIERIRSNINFTLLITGVTLVLVSTAFHVNIFNYESPVEYQYSNAITLKDFKGYKRPSQTLDGSNEFAFITTSIEWNKVGNEIEVKTLFHPSRSYVYNEKVVNNFLLQHELYHFHIAELFARKIRKALQRNEHYPSGDIINTTISTYKTLEQNMQREYDDQTYHGFILKQQKQWQHKVDSLLFSHQNFTNTKVSFNK